jgi:MYXO-CTERM domain-containing protein
MLKLVRNFLTPLAVVGVLAQSASAATTLFFDDFNRPAGSVVGNGWHEAPASNVRLVNLAGSHLGAMKLSTTQSFLSPSISVSASHDAINATGYDDVALSFDFELRRTEVFDTAYVEWRTGGSGGWTTLAQTVGGILLNDTWFSVKNLALGALATNNPDVGIEFRLRSSGTLLRDTDTLRIDNVRVTGEALAFAVPFAVVVPEPASWAVWGVLGLVGLFTTRRKRD